MNCGPRRTRLSMALCLAASLVEVAIARGDYRAKPEETIRGSGYVVQSLEAALWAFARCAFYMPCAS